MRSITIATLLVLAAAVGCAEGQSAPERWPDISHADLVSAIDAGTVTVIDVNGSQSFQKSHITGAIDYQAVSKELAKHLPAQKDTLIVAYCAGPACKAWKEAAKAASELGYSNVRHYSAGISGWQTEQQNGDDAESDVGAEDEGMDDEGGDE